MVMTFDFFVLDFFVCICMCKGVGSVSTQGGLLKKFYRTLWYVFCKAVSKGEFISCCVVLIFCG